MIKDLVMEISQNPKVAAAVSTTTIGSAKIAEWWGVITEVGSSFMVFIGAMIPISYLLLQFINDKRKSREHAADMIIKELTIEKLRREQEAKNVIR